MCKVQSITFMFKDCESIEVPEKYIGSIFIGDIQRNIERITLGCIQEKLICKEFYIEIFNEFNGEYDSLYDITTFERFMKARDITTLCIKYDNDSSSYFSLPYAGERDNLYQYTWLSRLGNLYLCVSERKCLDDYILPKDANDEVQVNLRKCRELKGKKKIDEDNYIEGEEGESEWLL